MKVDRKFEMDKFAGFHENACEALFAVEISNYFTQHVIKKANG